MLKKTFGGHPNPPSLRMSQLINMCQHPEHQVNISRKNWFVCAGIYTLKEASETAIEFALFSF